MSASTYTVETPRVSARVGECSINAPREGLGWLHFLDYDNLHGTGCPSIAQIDRVHDAYQHVGMGKTDPIYGACNHDPNRRSRVRISAPRPPCRTLFNGSRNICSGISPSASLVSCVLA